MINAYKNSLYDGKFDGQYGVWITLGNFRERKYNSLSHIETIFTLTQEMLDVLRAKYPDRFLDLKVGDKLSYSSIETDIDEFGKIIHGCRFKKISYSNYERWNFLPWDVTDKRFPKQWESELEYFKFCCERAGVIEYDIEGIVGKALCLPLDNPNQTFCSEEIGEKGMGFDSNPDPATLYDKHRETLIKEEVV